MGVPSRTSASTPGLDQNLYGLRIILGKVRPFTSPRRGPSTGSDHCSLVALAALYFTWQQARAAASQTELARRQTDLQQRQHEEAAQPYVWADLRPDEEHGFVIALVLCNNGPTVATDVRVTFDKPLPNAIADEWDGRHLTLSALAPGRQIVWWLKPGPEWFSSGHPRSFEVTIECNGPFGSAPVLRYRLNTDDFGDEQPTKRGSLYALTKSVDALTKVVKAQDK